MKYRAFLSYSHADEKWARWIHRSLERYRVPKHLAVTERSAGTPLKPVFLDRDELGSSTSLSASIQEALADSEALIVICSPAATESRWVNQEVKEYKALHGGANIFCCIVDGQAPAVFPPALLDTDEPLAADLTDSGDGKRDGFTKLVAGLLGVGFDELRRREYKRRTRRLAVAVALSLFGMAIMTFLGGAALISRGQAEQARQQAEQRREQAENLLAFMVGDLRKSLEPLGRLDLLDRVGDQAIAYFESIDAAAINDQSLVIQSAVLTQIGEIRMSQFRYEAAVEAFEQAYRFVEPLAERQPDDGEKLFQRGQAEFWVGYMRWRTGDLQGAQEWLQRYFESSLALVSIEPAREDWQQELAWGYHNLGVLAVEQQDLDRARSLFAQELEVLRELVDRSPDVAETRENIADAYSWLGRISERQGALTDAVLNYRESAIYREQLLAESPDHSGRKFWFIVASAFSADMLAISGRVDEAAETYARLIPLQAGMVDADPENREFQRYLARLQVDSAELSAAQAVTADSSNALAVVDEAILVLESLLRAEPDDRRVKAALVKANRVAATLYLLDNRSDRAAEFSSIALENISAEQIDAALVREMGAALVVAIMAQPEPVNDRGARLQEQISLFRQEARETRDPRTLDALARIAALNGDREQALAIFQTLDQAGYEPIWDWPEQLH